LKGAYSQIRAGLIETVLTLADQFHTSVGEAAEPFASSVISSMAKTALDRLFPENLPLFMNAAGRLSASTEFMEREQGYRWDWSVSLSSEFTKESAATKTIAVTDDEVIAENRNDAKRAWERTPEENRIEFPGQFNGTEPSEPHSFDKFHPNTPTPKHPEEIPEHPIGP
jgi:hypothetical protein